MGGGAVQASGRQGRARGAMTDSFIIIIVIVFSVIICMRVNERMKSTISCVDCSLCIAAKIVIHVGQAVMSPAREQ